MNRRAMMGALGIGAATLTAGGLAHAHAQARDDHDHAHGHDEHFELMSRCAKVCNEAAHHCLDMLREGKGDSRYHARAHAMTIDCQAFCLLSAALMARGSEFAGIAHEANAQTCAACAEVCEQSADDHPIMKECAEVCRACAEACRAMARHAKEHAHHAHP